MAEIKLTKSELRLQQQRLGQLEKYLPTLQLKKAMLQAEVNESRQEIGKLESLFDQTYHAIEEYGVLFSDTADFEPAQAARVVHVHKRYENIAGVDVPYFDAINFAPYSYNLFETPPWVDSAIKGLRSLVEARTKIEIAIEKRAALEKELREVSIRVNLFEKILIPRAVRNIKKIKVFLGDQQLAAVSQGKVAKLKIEERQAEASHAH